MGFIIASPLVVALYIWIESSFVEKYVFVEVMVPVYILLMHLTVRNFFHCFTELLNYTHRFGLEKSECLLQSTRCTEGFYDVFHYQPEI